MSLLTCCVCMHQCLYTATQREANPCCVWKHAWLQYVWCTYTEICVVVVFLQNISPPPKPFLQALLQPFSDRDLIYTPDCWERAGTEPLIVGRAMARDGDSLRDGKGTFTLLYLLVLLQIGAWMRLEKFYLCKTSCTETAHSLISEYDNTLLNCGCLKTMKTIKQNVSELLKIHFLTAAEIRSERKRKKSEGATER